MAETVENSQFDQGIAIIGMAGRFPGASDVKEFWSNLVEGKETIKRFTDEELEPNELAYEELKNNPNYIKAKGIIDGVEYFDASFFGYSPREASILDPQHRIWLEVAWTALEDAGYCPDKYPGAIGVFAGSYINSYLLYNLARDRAFIENYVRLRGGEAYMIMTGNDASYLPTRTAYKFNLKGPAINVQTACSTSLVAVAQACQSLFNYESDICIAGGICVAVPQETGYLHQEGAIPSSDGHCKPFDASASGTVFGNGAGVVILKRLDEAIADRDHIYAVIKGYGINNDGSLKVSYTAPSVEGQAQAIAMAQAMANFHPGSITYIEAHGTATPMGDPIEVAALTKAFRMKTSKNQYCAIGSVKSNFGHLDAAAGVAGLMKTTLALKNKVIPPTLHFQKPNPAIDFAKSPFYVASELIQWESETPRRAGVSSFGIGGTNAHVVLEEAPEVIHDMSSRKWKVLTFSAKSKSALNKQMTNLAEFLDQNPESSLADISYTLKVGRQDMPFKAIAVSDNHANTIHILSDPTSIQITRSQHTVKNPPVVFMFPGQGAQYADMGRELYETEDVFRNAVDKCAEIAKPLLSLDIRSVLFPIGGEKIAANEKLNQTEITQPALFIIEYALSRLWSSWGIEPDYMIGHSIGEYTAACIADVFSLEDALAIVIARGKLMQSMPTGAMRAIRLSPAEVGPYLNGEISLAAHNAPGISVVSGPNEAIFKLDKQFEGTALETIKLHTSHAFHSNMMEPAVLPFERIVSKFKLRTPRKPFISSLSGTWIKTEEAVDPKYWAQQLLKPVLFSKGINELIGGTEKIFLECGPSTNLSSALKQHQQISEHHHSIIVSLGHINEKLPAQKAILTALGKLWLNGVAINWDLFYKNELRRRIPLPTYPFERKKYWVDPVRTESIVNSVQEQLAGTTTTASARQSENQDILSDKHFYIRRTVKSIISKLSEIDTESLGDQVAFADLGFDSLFLTQISSALEKEFSVSIKFRQLSYEYPDIKSLSDYIESQLPAGFYEYLEGLATGTKSKEKVKSESKGFTNLALFQPNGKKHPFIMVHGDKGNEYIPKVLGPDQPYFGYFHQGADGDKIRYKTVKGIATHYINELLTVKPKGPYLLGGFSFGGIIAYEMAVQLQKMGHSIAMLLMVDCVNPYYKKYIYPKGFYNSLKRHLLSPVYRTAERKLKMMVAEIHFLFKKPIPTEQRNYYILEKYQQAYLKYKPEKFTGRAIVVKASENSCIDSYLGWKQLIDGEIELFHINGDHLSIINETENARIFSTFLKEKLLEYQKVDEPL